MSQNRCASICYGMIAQFKESGFDKDLEEGFPIPDRSDQNEFILKTFLCDLPDKNFWCTYIGSASDYCTTFAVYPHKWVEEKEVTSNIEVNNSFKSFDPFSEQQIEEWNNACLILRNSIPEELKHIFTLSDPGCFVYSTTGY